LDEQLIRQAFSHLKFPEELGLAGLYRNPNPNPSSNPKSVANAGKTVSLLIWLILSLSNL